MFNQSLLLRLLNSQPLAILIMIASFRHKGLRRFFETRSLAGIMPTHAKRLTNLLGVLTAANQPEDLNLPGFRLQALKGYIPPRWSVYVNGNWRLTFEFAKGKADAVDYEDYH